jgi:hypothetical protein
MTGRNRLWIALALAFAVGALLLATLGAGGTDVERILIAREPLERGAVLEDALLDGRAEWRAVAGAGALGGLLKESSEIRELRLASSVETGEPISRAALGGDSALPPLAVGERLVSLPLASAGAVVGTLDPGIQVDVASIVSEGPAGAAVLVAKRAEVVTVESDPSSVGQGAGGVVVKVGQEEALRISEAIGAGRDLRLIVRPAGAP